jgi:carnitine-CoA ligase
VVLDRDVFEPRRPRPEERRVEARCPRDTETLLVLAQPAALPVEDGRARPRDGDQVETATHEGVRRVPLRLGIPIYEIYGQTEADGVTFGTPERRRRGSTGWACSGFDVVILGPRGEHLPPGATGEIAYRPSGANMMLQGYWRRDEATVEACRDLWFRSGDLGYLGADSFLWFVGRMRDVLRRRGENISAFELETAVRNAPGVTDCAATAVRDPLGGEDEVKLFLALQDPTTFDAAAFFAWCDEHLPRFAVPRYVEIVDAALFVRSAGNGSIQKHLLPAGLGPATIDRLASQRP